MAARGRRQVDLGSPSRATVRTSSAHSGRAPTPSGRVLYDGPGSGQGSDVAEQRGRSGSNASGSRGERALSRQGHQAMMSTGPLIPRNLDIGGDAYSFNSKVS